MNRSRARTWAGALLVVSQFTLYGDARKGRRPSFAQAAAPAEAERLYRRFVGQASAARARGWPRACFQADDGRAAS